MILMVRASDFCSEGQQFLNSTAMLFSETRNFKFTSHCFFPPRCINRYMYQ